MILMILTYIRLDELKKAKADNDALVKVNQNIHSDIIKNERYKKVNTVEQDLLSKVFNLFNKSSSYCLS